MAAEPFAFTSRFLLATADAAGIPKAALGRRVESLFREVTKRVDPTVTVEVGAFEASFSVWVRQHLPGTRALAFEANPDVFQRFEESATAAGVDYVNACVGAVNGPVDLYIPEDFAGRDREKVNRMSSLARNLRTERHRTVTVDGIRLDDFLKLARDDRVVAWIDVEGALATVLPGSRATLERASAVYVEVESDPIWDGQWLDTDAAAWFAELDMVPIARDYRRAYQYNLLLVSSALAADPAVAKLAARVYLPVQEVADPAQPLPAPVPRSRMADVREFLRRPLRGEQDLLRAQNQELRREAERLRKRNRELRKRLASLDLES